MDKPPEGGKKKSQEVTVGAGGAWGLGTTGGGAGRLTAKKVNVGGCTGAFVEGLW